MNHARICKPRRQIYTWFFFPPNPRLRKFISFIDLRRFISFLKCYFSPSVEGNETLLGQWHLDSSQKSQNWQGCQVCRGFHREVRIIGLIYNLLTYIKGSNSSYFKYFELQLRSKAVFQLCFDRFKLWDTKKISNIFSMYHILQHKMRQWKHYYSDSENNEAKITMHSNSVWFQGICAWEKKKIESSDTNLEKTQLATLECSLPICGEVTTERSIS